MPARPPRKSLTPPRVILCEGFSDEAFFRELIKQRRIHQFGIRSCADADKSKKGGIDKFGKLLEAIPTWEGFSELRDIVIVADNDASPAKNFAKVCRLIERASPEAIPAPVYGVPDRALVSAAGTPARITVLMMPWPDVPGNLESLCLQAAASVSADISACVDGFVRCARTDEWEDPTKVDKMRLRSILAARHQKDPFIGLGNVWQRQQSRGLIPINHPCFDRIEAFLRSIP